MLLMTGCATVQVANYIKDDHPYTRRVYGSFDKVADAVRDVLAQEGFKITDEVDPAVFERDERYERAGARNLLIFTSVKQLPRVVYSKYFHLNIYLRSLADSTEVEVRYAKATNIMVKQFKGTRNDPYVNRLLDAIEAEIANK